MNTRRILLLGISWLLVLSALGCGPALEGPQANLKHRRETLMNGARVTFIGHATVLVELDGQAFLTDPVFSERVSGLPRHAPPGLAVEELPPLDAVLVSHGHYDHLDVPSLALLDPEVPVLAPPKADAALWGLNGREFVELAAWESKKIGQVTITAVPAKHFGGRYLVDSPLRPAVGFVLSGPSATVYFAGDTAYSEAFQQIGERFEIDLALLPIGAYSPRWMMSGSHTNPAEALQALEDLKARYMVPIHWGTFRLSLEPMAQPVERLQKIARGQGLEERVKVLSPGQSFSLPPKEDS